MTSPLELQDLTVCYGGRPALTAATWRASPGLTAIVGPNGSGKSTLLKAALGLVPRKSGTVRFLGEPLERVRSQLSYLPQRASVDWDFPASALDVVAMARTARSRWFGPLPRAVRLAALQALEEVGLAELAGRPIGRLSGGQQQRVFLARALCQNPQVFLMDEPMAGVDTRSEQTILGVLHNQVRQGRSVLMVHHDLSLMQAHADHLLILAGRVVASGPVALAFTKAAIAEAYGGLPEPAA